MHRCPSILTCLILYLLLTGCTEKLPRQPASATSSATLEAYSPVFPVLLGKEDNPVFRVTLPIAEPTGGHLKQVKLNFTGTTALTDIKAVRVFRTREAAFTADDPFAESENISPTLTLSVDKPLSADTHYLWLVLSLHEHAKLTHQIAARISAVELDQTMLLLPDDFKDQPKRIGHALRQHQDDGIHTFRIPGLVTTNAGTLLAVYDNRRNGSVDLQEDIDVGMSRSTDGGQTWEPMRIIMDMGEWGGLPQEQNGIGDPAILVDRANNTIWVAGIWAHGHPGERNWWASQPGLQPTATSQLMLTKSEDDGLTWSAPINITAQIKDPAWHLLLQGPGKGITLEDGTLVFAAQFKDAEEMPHATLVYSKDHGTTWQIGTGAKANTTEAQVVQLADRSLMLNMRDNRGSGAGKGTGARSVAITKDLGQNWIEHPTSRRALPEPVCMASLIKHTYRGQDLLLFSNPADQHHRQNITIKVSRDEGMTWPDTLYTLVDEGRGRGYSCLTTVDENTVGILYEGSQADLVFQVLKVKELLR